MSMNGQCFNVHFQSGNYPPNFRNKYQSTNDNSNGSSYQHRTGCNVLYFTRFLTAFRGYFVHNHLNSSVEHFSDKHQGNSNAYQTPFNICQTEPSAKHDNNQCCNQVNPSIVLRLKNSENSIDGISKTSNARSEGKRMEDCL